MRMIKKLSVMMTKRVGMRPRNLRMMYFVMVKKSCEGAYSYTRTLPRGQVGWMLRLPAAGAEREADPVILSTFPGSPALCLPAAGRGEELHIE
jgi:hypothetical protein